jgi:hypothetical protein
MLSLTTEEVPMKVQSSPTRYRPVARSIYAGLGLAGITVLLYIYEILTTRGPIAITEIIAWKLNITNIGLVIVWLGIPLLMGFLTSHRTLKREQGSVGGFITSTRSAMAMALTTNILGILLLVVCIIFGASILGGYAYVVGAMILVLIFIPAVVAVVIAGLIMGFVGHLMSWAIAKYRERSA